MTDLSKPATRVHFHSLGCAKNLLDTEVMVGQLATQGFVITQEIDDADAVVINTCSFIEAAREESIEAILTIAERRVEGSLAALVVAGCLPQRYGDALSRELPEVDAFVGTGDFPQIATILRDAMAGRGRGVYVEAGRTHLYDETEPRILVGPGHSAYLKIAEGCDRICSFCAIPGIRGRFQSRSAESIVAEAQQLGRLGVREINVISQDTTSWGKDQPSRPRLAELVRELDRVVEVAWIRLLYLYPSAISDDLLDAIASAERVLPYIDVPLQHGSDAMLKAMRRGTTAARQRDLVARIRERIPDVTIRTTLIVGFPGESERDFDALCQFVDDSAFDRVGVFRYSNEEGTAGYELSDQIPGEIARERYARLGALLDERMRARAAREIGCEHEVLVDAGGSARSVGRLRSQAPEVDGQVLLRGEAAAGELVRVRITGSRGIDLDAEILEPERARGSRADSLPEVALSPFTPKSAPQ